MVRAEEVFGLLENAKAEVSASLPQEELAPFRDAVAELVRAAKAEVERHLIKPTSRTSASAATLARSLAITESVFRSVIEHVAIFFRRASELSPVDDFCVLSAPESGADIVLYPPSMPRDRRGLRTASRVTLYLGRYAVEINNHAAGYVDVLLDPQRVVQCSTQTIADDQACRPISGTLELCP